MAATPFSDLAAGILGATTERKARRDDGEGPDPVRNYSYDADGPQANRWTRLGNGTRQEFRIWCEEIVQQVEDLLLKQRRERVVGPKRLQANDPIIMKKLLEHMNPATGELYPRQDTIAAEAGVSRSKVIQALQTFAALGFICWVRRKVKAATYGEAGIQWVQTSCGYYFDWRRLEERCKEAWEDLWARVCRRTKALQAAIAAKAAQLASRAALHAAGLHGKPLSAAGAAGTVRRSASRITPHEGG